MPAGRSRRLSPEAIQNNRSALIGLQSLPDYQPQNPACSVGELDALVRTMELAQQAEVRALQVLAAARDAAAVSEWQLHEAMLAAKAQVIAQYGPDAPAVQLVGLKRKSERRRPVRRVAQP